MRSFKAEPEMNHLHSILKIQRVNIMRKLRLLPCALLVLLAFPSSAIQAQGVQAVPVVSRSVETKVDLPGEFLPYESVPIHAKVAGFVEEGFGRSRVSC